MKAFLATLAMVVCSLTIAMTQVYQPYTLGALTTGSIDDVTMTVKTQLKANGIDVLGEYTPAKDPNRRVIAFTTSELKSAVRSTGGLTGFAAALRVAITNEDGNIVVSYNTPEYWGNAYFGNDFDQVSDHYSTLSGKLEMAMKAMGNDAVSQFGSKKGRDAKTLRNYKYTVMMPHFEDTELLAEFSSFEDAVATIDNNLKNGVTGIRKVYSIEFGDQKLKLYGIGMSGEKGEESYINTIDTYEHNHTAFFPYEMLVMNNEVHMLHGKYRIAISFPDTGMGRFMKISKAPGNIKDMMMMVVGVSVN